MSPRATRNGFISSRTSHWRSALVLVGALLLGLFSIAGIFAAASLQGAGYRTPVWIYLGLLVLSLVLVIGVIMWRWRLRNMSRPATPDFKV